MVNTAIGRRDFLRAGTGLASLAAAMPGARGGSVGEASQVSSQEYPCTYYPFTAHPDSDTCWSVSVGPDG